MPNPDNWSQEASDNLTAIAYSALDSAKNVPGNWINPLSDLRSEVRYNSATGDFEVVMMGHGAYNSRAHPIRVHGYDHAYAAKCLKDGWYSELRAGHSGRLAEDIVRDEILGATGWLAQNRYGARPSPPSRPASPAPPWSAPTQQTVPIQWERVVIDAREGGMHGAASLVNAIIGLGDRNAYMRGKFVAFVTTPNEAGGMYELAEFIYNAAASSLDRMWSIDRQAAQKTLDELLLLLQREGFQIVDRGAQWYSYTLRRPWNPSNPISSLFSDPKKRR